jgi:hypothetical protein
MEAEKRGYEITSVFKYVQKVFVECQRMLFKIDNLLAPNWKTIYGNRITRDVTTSLQDPERWLVEAIFRVYESTDPYVNKAITISFWGEAIEEPIITAGKITYKDLNKRNHWDLWNLCFHWGNDEVKDEYVFNGTLYNIKPIGCDYISEATIFSFPLVSISDDHELESKIIKTLRSL